MTEYRCPYCNKEYKSNHYFKIHLMICDKPKWLKIGLWGLGILIPIICAVVVIPSLQEAWIEWTFSDVLVYTNITTPIYSEGYPELTTFKISEIMEQCIPKQIGSVELLPIYCKNPPEISGYLPRNAYQYSIYDFNKIEKKTCLYTFYYHLSLPPGENTISPMKFSIKKPDVCENCFIHFFRIENMDIVPIHEIYARICVDNYLGDSYENAVKLDNKCFKIGKEVLYPRDSITGYFTSLKGSKGKIPLFNFAIKSRENPNLKEKTFTHTGVLIEPNCEIIFDEDDNRIFNIDEYRG